MADHLHKFLFEDGQGERAGVRGEIVSLDKTWQQIRADHGYPALVMQMLGEMVAASALLCANLKFNGALVMQIHGDGPVKLLVVECNADLTMRATVHLRENAIITDDADFKDLVNPHGNGRFAITLDPKNRLPGQQPYQGIVPLEGGSVAEVLEHYMHRSEQLETRMWLAADESRACGLLLQKLPSDGGKGRARGEHEGSDETFTRAATLAATLGRDELLAESPDTLMRRLFWEETLRVFEPQPCSFQCSCSRERVAAMLVSLGKDEIDDTLKEQGDVLVRCEFCNRAYEFDAVDCAQLFATDNTADGVRPAQARRH